MQCRYDVLSKKMNTDDTFKLDVIQKTSFLDESSGNVQRLWHILNNIYTVPNCKECGRTVSFSKRLGKNKGYNAFCSPSCRTTYINKSRDADAKKIRNELIKKTCLEKYGVEHFSKASEIKKKKLNTYLNKYGVDNPSKLESVKEKKRKTCINNYGVDNPSKSIEIHSKKSSSTRNKKMISPNGKVYYTDGYESIAITELFNQGYTDRDILTRNDIRNEIGLIRYRYKNKDHVYHPDIFVKIDNKIIEVKSEYWFHRCFKLNMKKKSVCKKLGFEFEFWIYDSKKNRKIK